MKNLYKIYNLFINELFDLKYSIEGRYKSIMYLSWYSTDG